MSEQFVATKVIMLGNARAANPGDIIDGETVRANGWEDSVAKQGTKAAEKAADES